MQNKNPHENILIYGGSGEGKSTLIGEYAKWLYKTKKLKTRLYAADKGGFVTLQPLIDVGVVLTEELSGDPWIWINNATRGNVRDEKGNWVSGIKDEIGCYAFDGMAGISEALGLNISEQAVKGVKIGMSAFVFNAGALKIATIDQGHYNIIQQRMLAEIWQSQTLPGTLIWTAPVKKDESDTAAQVLGPLLFGKALTAAIPRWFKYTFRVASVAQPSGPAEHVLYLDSHLDQNAGMAMAMANARVPLEGASVVIPSIIKPASLVAALDILNKRQEAAKVELKKELGL